MQTNIRIHAILAALIALTSAQGFAQDSHPYIGGQIYFIHADDRLEGRPGSVDEDRNAGASGYIGFPIRPQFNIELQLFLNDINTQDGFRNDIYEPGGNIDLVYQWGDRDRFTPFVLGGIGIIRNQMGNNTRSNHTTGYGNLGAGFVFAPNLARNKYGIRFRGEVRYAHNTLSGGQDDFQARAGLEIPLGRTVERTVEVEKVVEKRVPVPMEQAPKSRAPDADQDGVANNADVCPNTMPNTVVDQTGCAIGLREINQVTFLFDSVHLTPNAKKLLDMAARALQGQPDIRVQIAGHTDAKGTANYNQRLSQERAVAVRDYLVNRGVNARRISTTAHGESKPAADNNTASGRELNRRAELLINL